MSIEAAEVLAVVVSYNGAQSLGATVERLRDQVGAVLIVDNGSGPETQRVLDGLATAGGVKVVRLGANRGIGHALNVGVRTAQAEGCTWLLTMDQDSLVEPGFLAAYAGAVTATPTLACLTPEVVGGSAARSAALDRDVTYAITSGNLVRLSLFGDVGAYDEGMFIDCVDFDFSLRVRRRGHRIVRVHGARMQHQLGDAVALPAALRPFYARHSPVRRYYMYRNFLYLAERHLLAFPVFILKLGLLQVILAVLVAFHDHAPLRSYRAMARGTWDYLRRRHGPVVLTA